MLENFVVSPAKPFIRAEYSNDHGSMGEVDEGRSKDCSIAMDPKSRVIRVSRGGVGGTRSRRATDGWLVD